MQSVIIPPNLNAPWHLPLLIRRSPPWVRDRPRFPVPTFFDAVRTGAGVDVYMIDTGVDLSHPETLGKVTNVFEFYSSGGLGDDTTTGHGTASASLIAGNTVGAAKNATLFSFKGYDSASIADNTSIGGCLDEVLDHYLARAALDRPAVCMVNYGGISSSGMLTQINDLIDAGMIVTASVHNYGDATPRFPASIDDVIGVGGINAAYLPYRLGRAVDTRNSVQIGTGHGSQVDILAPAENVWMADKFTAGFMQWSGNSWSAPIVTSVIACMLEGHGRLAGRSEVRAANAKLLANATTGLLRPAYGYTLPDRVVYLDPALSFEPFFEFAPPGDLSYEVTY